MNEKRGQPPKRKFEFDPWDGLCDIYVDGKKVREAHQAKYGHIYFHLPPDFPDEGVTAEPFDPRVQVEAFVEGGKVVLTEECQEEQERKAEEARKQAELKRKAEIARREERKKREAEAKKNAEQRVAAALAAKARADKEAADAEREGLNMGPDLKME